MSQEHGIQCPNCQTFNKFMVLESVPIEGGKRRRLECKACETRITTHERIAVNPRITASPSSKMCYDCHHNPGNLCDLGHPDFMEDGPQAANWCNNFQRK